MLVSLQLDKAGCALWGQWFRPGGLPPHSGSVGVHTETVWSVPKEEKEEPDGDRTTSKSS